MANADPSKNATRKLARHAATLKYNALPPELVDLTKQCVLDTLGVSIGASTLAPEGRIISEYVIDLGGKPETTILGFGGKAPAPWAVFVNGSLGHMLDYDDVGEGGHVSISTVPVAFGIAEKNGTATGKELITAIAAGTDVHTRLALSIDIPDWTMTEGWFATQLFGYISGAATAGRLLGLDEEQMENALGVGYNQLSGSRQMAVGAATHMRSMQAGFSGQAAVSGAELARRGIIGCKEIVEGRYGLFKNYVRTETPNWAELVGELGIRFPLLKNHGFKVWPACAYTRCGRSTTFVPKMSRQSPSSEAPAGRNCCASRWRASAVRRSASTGNTAFRSPRPS
jgi:2-methylcitrate dehydratase PrpD